MRAAIYNLLNKSWLITYPAAALFIMVTLAFSVHPAGGQDQPAWSGGPDTLAEKRQEVKKYLIEKYGKKDAYGNFEPIDIEMHAEKTNGAERRSLSIRDGLTLPKKVAPKEGEHGEARAVAETFLAAEASYLFGITNPSDLREMSISADKQGTTIWYRRYVNDLRLSDAVVQMVVGPEAKIFAIQANLYEVPAELLHAVNRRTIAEADVRRIVEEDLQAAYKAPETEPIAKKLIHEIGTTKHHPKSMNVEKIAVPYPPYVVWEAASVWKYTLDAFNGSIVKKLPAWRD